MRLTSALWKICHPATHIIPPPSVPLAAGGAPYEEWTTKVIRFVRHGCANRPFFHIVVQEAREEQYGNVIEQVGSYDPLPNQYNEKIVGMNFSRIEHWIHNGAVVSTPVKILLGLGGYYPVHPRSYKNAWVKRKLLMDTLAELEAAAASSTAPSNDSVSENESPT